MYRLLIILMFHKDKSAWSGYKCPSAHNWFLANAVSHSKMQYAHCSAWCLWCLPALLPG